MQDHHRADSRIEIIDFRPRLARYFRELNLAWLERYFEVEPYDRIVLNDPQNQVIRLGGSILFARLESEIVGTCALLRHTERKFELAKMAVAESHQGRGIGRRLTEAAIARARQQGAGQLVLATSRLLEPANRLYRACGFEYAERDVIGPIPYQRETVVMSLTL
ncbi:GNAT family N-acetyltransferase [candidate division GN15 bacterium]|nr:GNAT family N-acetyltransferase [candidate division GN15 bacterium]